MKINARYSKHLFDKRHHAELTLIVPNYRHTIMLDELDCDKNYIVEIKEVKSQRSIEQNKLLWALLHALEKHTKEVAMDWYIKALIDTGAQTEYLWATEKTEDGLKKQFRAIQRVKPHKIGNSDGWLYRVFIGSSKFNISQMNELLDTVIRYCNEHDIDTEVYSVE